MNIESLKYFNLIAKAGNISCVAREQHITQSALSQKINKLETDLANPLMVRSNKGVTLTEAGKIVFNFSESILKSYDSMVSDIANNRINNAIIKIQACNSIADYAVPCTLMLANRKYPNHKYELSSSKSKDVYNNVANNIYDIGFAYKNTCVENKYDDMVYVASGKNKIVLVSKYSEELSATMTLDKLLNSCLITLSNDSHITKVVLDKLNRAGIEKSSMNCNLEVETLQSAKTLVDRGYGLAFLPYIAVKEELYKKKYKQVTVPGFEIDLDVMMMFKKDHPECIKEFVDWFVKFGKSSFC